MDQEHFTYRKFTPIFDHDLGDTPLHHFDATLEPQVYNLAPTRHA